MKLPIKFVFVIFVLFLLPQKVCAVEYTAPAAPQDIAQYIPEKSNDFSKDLLYVIRSICADAFPDISETIKTCISLIAVAILISISGNFAKVSKRTLQLITALSIGTLILTANHSLINIGTDAIDKMADYGKLLLPAIAAATAANGGTTTSTAIYGGTFLFINILTALIVNLFLPLIYIYMALCFADCAAPCNMFTSLKKTLKNFMSWSIKVVLLLFSTYMSITGAISGSVDGAAIKAAKLTISGIVPIVGSAISDASETILVSAGMAKNSIGIYGLFTVIAICVGPFLKIGINYLFMKGTSAVAGIFADKNVTSLIDDLTSVMGIILAITSTVCLLLLISIVCFIRSAT